MIKAEFFCRQGQFVGFAMSGHAGYDDYGHDIVCAGVTSAVQTIANGISECAKLPADIDVKPNSIQVMCSSKQADVWFKALHLQLSIMAQQYTQNIKLISTEV